MGLGPVFISSIWSCKDKFAKIIETRNKSQKIFEKHNRFPKTAEIGNRDVKATGKQSASTDRNETVDNLKFRLCCDSRVVTVVLSSIGSNRLF